MWFGFVWIEFCATRVCIDNLDVQSEAQVHKGNWMIIESLAWLRCSDQAGASFFEFLYGGLPIISFEADVMESTTFLEEIDQW